MNDPDSLPVESERSFHQYTGTAIPWFVRLIWIGFWCLAVYYTVVYLFPHLQRELIVR